MGQSRAKRCEREEQKDREIFFHDEQGQVCGRDFRAMKLRPCATFATAEKASEPSVCAKFRLADGADKAVQLSIIKLPIRRVF